MVAHRDDYVWARERVEELLAALELAAIALHGQVAFDDREVWVQLVGLRDGGGQQLAPKQPLADVQVRRLDDPHVTTATARDAITTNRRRESGIDVVIRDDAGSATTLRHGSERLNLSSSHFRVGRSSSASL
jgi:hypothetical protein